MRYAILLLLLAAFGCEEAPLKASSLAPRGFNLGGQRFVIELPAGAAIQVEPTGNLVRIELRPGTRYPTVISLRSPRAGETAERFGRTESLGDSRILAYRVSSATVGSGGPEAFLEGRLTLANRPYIVTCHAQGDHITEDEAVWCLRYLQTISPVDADVK